jgi:hypothetical protein
MTVQEIVEDMLTPEPVKKFYARADRLRKAFGYWDACDPAAQAILNLVAAQNSIAQATDRYSARRQRV